MTRIRSLHPTRSGTREADRYQLVDSGRLATGVSNGTDCYALAVSSVEQSKPISTDAVMKVIALYHCLVGGVLALLPRDLCAFLAIELPRYWLLYYLLAAASLLAGLMLYLAGRHPHLRPGLVLAVALGNLVNCGLFVFFVAWSQLPALLFGSAVSSGLMAWILFSLPTHGLPTEVEGAQ